MVTVYLILTTSMHMYFNKYGLTIYLIKNKNPFDIALFCPQTPIVPLLLF